MNLKGRNILVTGGTGHIGSYVVEKCVAEGALVTILGRNPRRQENIKTAIRDNRVVFVECDMANEERIRSLPEDIGFAEYLVHLASAMEPVYNGFFENARHSVDVNIKGTIHLLKRLPNLRGICYASSMAVYGAPPFVPLDESCPTKPINFYGAAKLAAEKYLEINATKQNVNLSLLRYSSVYGPGNYSTRALPTFIKNALKSEPITIKGDGSVVRDYVYVSDATDATVNAMKLDASGVFNIGSGKGQSVRNLAETIVRLSGSRSVITYLPAPRDFDFIYDITKARNMLGFAPKISLEEGLANEIAWHRARNI